MRLVCILQASLDDELERKRGTEWNVPRKQCTTQNSAESIKSKEEKSSLYFLEPTDHIPI